MHFFTCVRGVSNFVMNINYRGDSFFVFSIWFVLVILADISAFFGEFRHFLFFLLRWHMKNKVVFSNIQMLWESFSFLFYRGNVYFDFDI